MAKVSEIYAADASIGGSKHVLSVMDDGTLGLMWYHGDSRVPEKDPVMVSVGGDRFIEFGVPNLFGLRQRTRFMSKSGILDEKWERIK